MCSLNVFIIVFDIVFDIVFVFVDVFLLVRSCFLYQMSQRSKVSKIAPWRYWRCICLCLCLRHCLFVGQVMFSHWYDCPRWVAGEQPAARLEFFCRVNGLEIAGQEGEGQSQNSIEFLLWLASCPGIDTPRVRDLWVSCGIHPKVLQARVWKELLT